jgi:cytochrome c1
VDVARCSATAADAASAARGVALAGAAKAQERASVDAAQACLVLRQYGCNGCHAISGMSGPRHFPGPPLARLARREPIAGRWPNNDANLRALVQHPQRLDPLSAMLELRVSDAAAALIAAYLATLK